ncbi:MAG: class I SAM-dependent DNA methyltransferase [Candidatus Thorarchaeota archaeon]
MKSQQQQRVMGEFYSRLGRYYDQFYVHIDYEGNSRRLHEIIQRFKKSRGNSLLDVACGTGTHIKHLKDWYHPTGLDLVESMLEVAKEKCPDIEFFQGNMTDFDLGRMFDVITCLFGSIGYLTERNDLENAIASFSRHTEQGGILVIEPMFTKESVREGSIGITSLDLPDIKISRVNSTQIEGAVAYLNFHFLIATRENGVEHFIDPSPMSIFSRDLYISLMEKHGFETEFLEPGLMKEGLFLGVKQ